jgi:predicted membrane GTPase involved in stress response
VNIREEFPLSTLVSSNALLPAAFGAKVRSCLENTSRYVFEPDRNGVKVKGVWEADVAAGIREIQDKIGNDIRIEPVAVKYIEEEKLLEPVLAVRVETPEEYVGDIMGDLNRRRGYPLGMDNSVEGIAILATVPLPELIGYEKDLAKMSHGQAKAEADFHGYQPVPPSTPPFNEPKSGAMRA